MTAPARDRAERARRAAEALKRAHRVIAEADDGLGALDDVLDHVARVARLADETATRAATTGRR